MIWTILASMAICVAVMLRFSYAYFVFPTAVEKCLAVTNLGPFHAHLKRTSNFVRLCGHAHWIMALRDLAMIGVMVFGSNEVRFVGAIIFVSTLPPLIYGGEYSVRAAKLLESDADAIQRFITMAQRMDDGRMAEDSASDH